MGVHPHQVGPTAAWVATSEGPGFLTGFKCSQLGQGRVGGDAGGAVHLDGRIQDGQHHPGDQHLPAVRNLRDVQSSNTRHPVRWLRGPPSNCTRLELARLCSCSETA